MTSSGFRMRLKRLGNYLSGIFGRLWGSLSELLGFEDSTNLRANEVPVRIKRRQQKGKRKYRVRIQGAGGVEAGGMAVIVVREYPGNRANVAVSVVSAGAANAEGESPSAGAGYAVFPKLSGGIFDNDVGITNNSALWYVVSEDPLDGAFSYRDGGGFTYVTGDQSGTATFVYRIVEFDGVSDTEATVRVTVT